MGGVSSGKGHIHNIDFASEKVTLQSFDLFD